MAAAVVVAALGQVTLVRAVLGVAVLRHRPAQAHGGTWLGLGLGLGLGLELGLGVQVRVGLGLVLGLGLGLGLALALRVG